MVRVIAIGNNRMFLNSKNRRAEGFSLLELLIAMFILVILIAVAVPTYRTSVQHARETVLKQNLFQMRRAIDQYTADKSKLPQSLEELKEAGYLREIPIDPVNRESQEWNPVMDSDPNSTEGDQGMVDVKSRAEGEDSEGVPYSEY